MCTEVCSVVLDDEVVSHVVTIFEVQRENVTGLLVHEIVLVGRTLDLNAVVLLAILPDNIVLIFSLCAVLAHLVHDIAVESFVAIRHHDARQELFLGERLGGLSHQRFLLAQLEGEAQGVCPIKLPHALRGGGSRGGDGLFIVICQGRFRSVRSERSPPLEQSSTKHEHPP